jgi:hypothetical protein
MRPLMPSIKHPWYVQPAGKPVPSGVEIDIDDDTLELVFEEAAEPVPKELADEETPALVLDARDVSLYISK